MIDFNSFKRSRFAGSWHFNAKFNRMRKPQNFVVYPKGAGDTSPTIKIQSSTRIGLINLQTGEVTMCLPQSGGAYCMHLEFGEQVKSQLSEEELECLKSFLGELSGSSYKGSVMSSDNSGMVSMMSLLNNK